MTIGLWDLVLIYSLPLLILGLFGGVFLLCLYLFVRFDLFHLDFSYDVLIGLKHRKKAFSLFNVAFLMLFDNGMQATFLYRVSRVLYLHRMGQAALVINKVAKFFTNMDISPSAKIGKGLSLWHGTSIIIAQFADMGERCVVRQGVTVCGFGKVRVGDDVGFSHGSFAIEGNPDPVVIGDGSVVAANAVVTRSVPAHHIASGVPADTIIAKPETRIQGVIFDLDRIIADSEQAVYASLQNMMERLGRKPLSLKKIQKYRTLPLPVVLQRHLGGEDLEKGAGLFNEHFMELCSKQVVLREGVEETLKRLQEMEVRVGAFSRHYRFAVDRIVKVCGLEDTVRAVRGADEISEWKPHPKLITQVMSALELRKENAVYVGCSTIDLRTGNNAAVRVVLLPVGEESKERLARNIPRLVDNRVLDHMSRIPDYVLENQEGTLSSEAVCM